MQTIREETIREEKQFIPTRPQYKLITERSGWVQPDGSIKFSKDARTYLKEVQY